MSMPEFPNADPTYLNGSIDSSTYSVSRENTTQQTDLEGGYATTRPRFTRRGRRTFTFSFTEISQSQMTALDDFYTITTKGGSLHFIFVVPTVAGGTAVVRFNKDPLVWTYKGVLNNRKWSTNLILQEV